MNELLTFGYKVETADLKRGEKALDDFSNANKEASASLKSIEKSSTESNASLKNIERTLLSLSNSLNKTQSEFGKTSNVLSGFKAQIAAVTSAISAFTLINLADQYTKFTAQLKLATNSQEEFAKAYSNVVSIARGSQ